MKKSLLLILTLIFTATLVAPTRALYVDDDDAKWYTVSELLEYREELAREEKESCGNDTWCKQEYFYNKMESEPRVLALDQMLQQQFVLTAANPGEGYIKVMFFGEDMMLSRMGIHEEIGIETVYIGWLEYDPERIYYQGMDYDRYANDKIDGLHTIYAWQKDSSYENLIHSDEEVILEAENLINNTNGQLVYFVDSGEGKFNAIGRLIYANCLNETDYIVGTECKLMTSAEKGQAYYPPRETILTNEYNNENGLSGNSNDSTLTDENNSSNFADTTNDSGGNNITITSDSDVATENDVNSGDIDREVGARKSNQNDENDIGNENSADESETKPKAAAQKSAEVEFGREVKAPDTGANLELCKQKKIEFPWWLAALIIAGDAVIMWLFWPNRKKVRKN